MTTNIQQLQIHRWARAGYVAPLKTRAPLFPGLRRELIALAIDYGRTVDDGHCGVCGMREGHVSGCVLDHACLKAKAVGLSPLWKATDDDECFVRVDGRGKIYNTGSSSLPDWCCMVAGRCCCIDVKSTGEWITEAKVASAYVDAHLAAIDAGAQP